MKTLSQIVEMLGDPEKSHPIEHCGYLEFWMPKSVAFMPPKFDEQSITVLHSKGEFDGIETGETVVKNGVSYFCFRTETWQSCAPIKGAEFLTEFRFQPFIEIQ